MSDSVESDGVLQCTDDVLLTDQLIAVERLGAILAIQRRRRCGAGACARRLARLRRYGGGLLVAVTVAKERRDGHAVSPLENCRFGDVLNRHCPYRSIVDAVPDTLSAFDRGPRKTRTFLLGTLYVVATPIGNLEDLSPRAARVLREVALIAAEDTRHSRRLLTHFAIETPTVSYHEHNQVSAASSSSMRWRRVTSR